MAAGRAAPATVASPASSVRAGTAAAGVALAIANPPAGAIYSVDPTLRRQFQALPLRAVTAQPTEVTWLVDGTLVGRAASDQSLAWPLAVGTHDIEVRDRAGRRARTSVVVK